MDKTEKSSKMLGNFLDDCLPILYQKAKNEKIFWFIRKASISNYRCHTTKCLKIFFWTLFYKPVSLCRAGEFKFLGKNSVTFFDKKRADITKLNT